MQQNEEILYDSAKKEISLLRSEIQAIRILSKNNKSQPESLPGQYYGKPIPSRIGTEIHIDARGAFSPQKDVFSGFLPYQTYEGKIPIALDGDFVAIGVYFFFRFDNGAISQSSGIDIEGMWRRASSSRVPYLFFAPNFYTIGVQDIYWEYDVSRTHRIRQNIPVPSGIVSMAEGGNGFFPLVPQDVFPKGETVTVRITPTHPLFINQNPTIPSNPWPGTFWCGFNGFYILEG